MRFAWLISNPEVVLNGCLDGSLLPAEEIGKCNSNDNGYEIYIPELCGDNRVRPMDKWNYSGVGAL